MPTQAAAKTPAASCEKRWRLNCRASGWLRRAHASDVRWDIMMMSLLRNFACASAGWVSKKKRQESKEKIVGILKNGNYPFPDCAYCLLMKLPLLKGVITRDFTRLQATEIDRESECVSQICEIRLLGVNKMLMAVVL